MMSAVSRGHATRLALVVPLLILVVVGCNRRTEDYVPPEQEPPAPERPVRIPSLAESRPSFDEIRGAGRPPAPPVVPSEGSSGQPIQGTVTLAEGVTAGPGVLFVIARAQPGPPLAVKRLEPQGFPVEFSLGPADVMQGGPFVGELELTARLDRDGNPMTRQPEDLVGEVEGRVQPGASGVEIVLRPSDR